MSQGIKRVGYWLSVAVLAALLAACGGGNSANPAGATSPPVAAKSSPPTVDATRAAAASIGFAGGSVTATAANGTAYTLQVPAGALTETTEIRLSPIIDMGTAPLSKNVLAAVQMEPSGLKFRLPATLKIGVTPVLAVGQTLVGFGSANDGSNMRLTLPALRNGGVELKVAHFSNAGVAGATAEEAAAVPLDPKQDPGEVDFWIHENYVGDRSPTTLGENFLSWYNGVVLPRLAAASGTADSTLDALAAYETWINAINVTPDVFNIPEASRAQMMSLLAAQIKLANDLVSAILRAKLQANLAACATNPGIELVEFASLMQQIAARFGLDKQAQGLDRASFLQSVNDCLRPVMDPITLPTPLPVGTPKSLDAKAQLVFNGNPTPQAAAFEFTVTPTGATLAKPVGFSDAAGAYTTVFTPSANTVSFNVRACLVLNGTNGTVGSDICVTEVVSRTLPEANVFSGTVTATTNHTNGGQRVVSAFVRVRVNANFISGEVIEFRGTESHHYPGEQFCARTKSFVPTSDVGTGTVTIATYGRGSATFPGRLELQGVATITQTFMRPFDDTCTLVTQTSTRGVGNEDNFAELRDPVMVFEGGRLVSIDYSKFFTQTGITYTATGVLRPEN